MDLVDSPPGLPALMAMIFRPGTCLLERLVRQLSPDGDDFVMVNVGGWSGFHDLGFRNLPAFVVLLGDGGRIGGCEFDLAGLRDCQ